MINSLENLAKEMMGNKFNDIGKFNDIDMRSDAEQFALNDTEGNHTRLMSVSQSLDFHSTIQTGRVMTQAEGQSLFFMIKMVINHHTLLGIFDTGSSDMITLTSCMEEPAVFLNVSLGEKCVQVVVCKGLIRSCGL